jgi:ribosomal protein L40E
MIVQFINLLLAGVIIGLVTGFAIFVWAIFDAYKTAEKINAEASEQALQNYKVCPQCAERVSRDARICRYCGYQFYPAPVATLPALSSQPLQTTTTNTIPDTNTAVVGTSDTKYCPNCGGANSANAKFCIECGHAFQQAQAG